MENNKALRLIGLATRAGKVITGIDLCQKAVKANKAELGIVTNETAQSTVDIFKNTNVPLIYVESIEKLSRFVGKENRSVAVITDKGFAEVILKESEEIIC